MPLNRWTGITAVFSRPHPDATLPNGKCQPKWPALFKGKGTRSNLTPPDPRCKVPFAPNGTVTGDTWLEYLKYHLPRVAHPENAVVTTTDRYTPLI